MARVSFAFSNFTAGELSPRLDGRTDINKYFNGTKTMELSKQIDINTYPYSAYEKIRFCPYAN